MKLQWACSIPIAPKGQIFAQNGLRLSLVSSYFECWIICLFPLLSSLLFSNWWSPLAASLNSLHSVIKLPSVLLNTNCSVIPIPILSDISTAFKMALPSWKKEIILPLASCLSEITSLIQQIFLVHLPWAPFEGTWGLKRERKIYSVLQ